jgi:phosphatidylglycerol:prolipoprotein diacylglycerol transferase
MYPILFHIGSITIYSYGFFIMLGALAAYYYALKQAPTIGLTSDSTSEMTLLLILSAYAGGKIFLWFSDWDYYMQHPMKMIAFSGSGFVFYGSFIVCILSLLVFFRIKKINAAPAFDVLAVCTALVHGFGKIGCLMAGCCHGKICSPFWGIVYHDPLSQAHPLHTPLYPAPIIDSVVVFCTCLFLMRYHKKKKFNGELMLLYVLIYSTNRFFTEFLRGDDDRGFIGALSQSQWVSIILLLVAGGLYWWLGKSSKMEHSGT